MHIDGLSKSNYLNHTIRIICDPRTFEDVFSFCCRRCYIMDDKVNNDVQIGSPILINDGPLGSCNSRKFRTIVLDGADAFQLTAAAKSATENTRAGLRRVYMFSIGNKDISMKGHDLRSTGRRSNTPDMATIVIDEMSKFNREVLRAGGRVMVTSLIPRPADVDPSVSSNSLNLQRFLSRAYVQLNNEIRQFNQRNDVLTVDLKCYVEVSPRRKGQNRVNRVLYEGNDDRNRRQQRIINTKLYEEDYIHVKEVTRERMMKFAKNCLLKEDWKFTQQALLS